jgi:hypothetical protein
MGYNTADVRKVAGGFVAYKLQHDNTKPIRGNTKNIRPLGSRRHHIMADIHMPDDNTVQLRYYGQTLVEWRSDNTYSVFAPKYYSAYTPDNIHNFLPDTSQNFLWSEGRMFYCTNHQRKEVYEIPRHIGRLDFQYVDGRSFLLNAPVAYNIRAKRGKLTQVMSRYEGFLSWMQVVLAVTETFDTEAINPVVEKFVTDLGFISAEEYTRSNTQQMTQEERDAHWDERYARDALPFGYGYNDWRRGVGFHAVACDQLRVMMAGDDPHKWVEVIHIMASQAGRYTWSPKTARKVKPEEALDWLKELMSYLHRDEVFDRIRLPKGAKPSRTNAKFFKENPFVPRKLRHGVDESNVK